MKLKFDSYYLKMPEFWAATVIGTILFFGMATYWYMNGSNHVALFAIFMWVYAVVAGALKRLVSINPDVPSISTSIPIDPSELRVPRDYSKVDFAKKLEEERVKRGL